MVPLYWHKLVGNGNGVELREIRSGRSGHDLRSGAAATALVDVAVLGPANGFRGCDPRASGEPRVANNDSDRGSSGFRNVSPGGKAAIPSAASRPILMINMP